MHETGEPIETQLWCRLIARPVLSIDKNHNARLVLCNGSLFLSHAARWVQQAHQRDRERECVYTAVQKHKTKAKTTEGEKENQKLRQTAMHTESEGARERERAREKEREREIGPVDVWAYFLF